jgi:hypothetical protein
VRFGLAQVARSEAELGPAIGRALEQHPEPDGSFARRPSTASLILSDERRARQLPAWRVRTARAATSAVAAFALASWMLTTGTSYKLVSHFVHMRPITAVSTSRPEVGVLVDASANQLPQLANVLSASGMHASFALDRIPSGSVRMVIDQGDQAVPRLPTGGLVRWLGTRGALRRMAGPIGPRHHFLYASSGPSVGQWWLAHRAGGRLVAGAVRVGTPADAPDSLQAGEVVELRVPHTGAALPLLKSLRQELRARHLSAVPVGRLIHDAGTHM